MKIGIYGGTFDPWTNAHAEIVMTVLDMHLVDEVVVVPTVVNYYRTESEKWLTDEQRLYAISEAKLFGVRQLRERGFRVSLSSHEVDKLKEYGNEKTKSDYCKGRRFYHTLVDFRNIYPEDELYTIIGTDQFEKFKTWFMWEDILAQSQLIVIQGRCGLSVFGVDIPHIDVRIDPVCAEVSATAIRKDYMNSEDGLERYVNGQKPKKNVLLHTPIFDVIEKKEVQEGFKPVGIDAPEWAMVLVSRGNEWLVVSQLRYGIMEQCTEFVCGQVDENEKPIHAAIRELREEAGITVSENEIKYLGQFRANPAFMSNRMHYYLVDLDSIGPKMIGNQELDEHEKISVSWMNKDEFLVEYLETGASVFIGTALWLYQNKNDFSGIVIEED